jgi:hypothetical protein
VKSVKKFERLAGDYPFWSLIEEWKSDPEN